MLMLDGFVYDDLPDDLMTFTGLTTFQPVSLGPLANTYARIFLHPSWKKNDLFALARSIRHDGANGAKFTDTELEQRYYYAGGSVRESFSDRASILPSACMNRSPLIAYWPQERSLWRPISVLIPSATSLWRMQVTDRITNGVQTRSISLTRSTTPFWNKQRGSARLKHGEFTNGRNTMKRSRTFDGLWISVSA